MAACRGIRSRHARRNKRDYSTLMYVYHCTKHVQVQWQKYTAIMLSCLPFKYICHSKQPLKTSRLAAAFEKRSWSGNTACMSCLRDFCAIHSSHYNSTDQQNDLSLMHYLNITLQLILWCLFFSSVFLRLRKLQNFGDNFVPKCNFLRLVPALHPRFHIEDKIFLFSFCKLRPCDWPRVWSIWSSERKRNLKKMHSWM